MVKFIITVFCLFLLCWGYIKFSERNEIISYNEVGSKIVRVTCDSDESFKCKLIVGKHCGESGYSIESLKTNIDDEDVLVVICGESKKNIIESFLETN